MRDPVPNGWTIATYAAHNEALRLAQEKFEQERDREPLDPDPAPIDQSDLDLVSKQLKALGLVVATWNGKTPAQLKTAFKQAFDSLP